MQSPNTGNWALSEVMLFENNNMSFGVKDETVVSDSKNLFSLQNKLTKDRIRLFYLATAPELFGVSAQFIRENSLANNKTRIIIGKGPSLKKSIEYRNPTKIPNILSIDSNIIDSYFIVLFL